MNAPFPSISAEFVVDLYHCYLRDPNSVDASWRPYFERLYGPQPEALGASRALLEAAAVRLIEAYRQRGHYRADLDPLSLWAPPSIPDLAIETYGIGEDALDTEVSAPEIFGLERCTVRALLHRLQAAYSGPIGFDIAHVEDHAARNWLHQVAESGAFQPDAEARRTAAARIIEADEFEQFMSRRFLGKKRFGSEGAEAIAAWFDAVLARSAALGVEQVVMGGTARGRLVTMANIVNKPITALFYELKGHSPFPEGLMVSGDVPYHLGYLGERGCGAKSLQILYCNNPSHLEAVDGVAAGRVRRRQRNYADERSGWQSVQGITVHTDAAFAGQGVVAEILQLSRVPAYRIGGTIRLVINNQIGFTTEPVNGRSSTFCTDVAKTVGAPVLHVNADDVDAVVRCAHIAAEYRHRFHADIVVDLVCYRRRGHNEVDEPTFTQPQMYRRIAEHPTVRQIYVECLSKENVLTATDAEQISRAYVEKLEAAYEAIDSFRPNLALSSGSAAAGEGRATGGETRSVDEEPSTGISPEALRSLGAALSQVPDGFHINPKIARQLADRERAIETGDGIQWPFSEALAYASLANEGIEVRVSGQDTPRGAFSQRHFVLFDQESGAAYDPLNSIGGAQAPCAIIGSPLSEYAVLGFEYGYSLDAAKSLVVWEAQFGDFANVAQVIIDQFISSSHDKWLDASALTLLLPHGQEGQGPDHSSGRIERFLQLCARENMRVANCTSPANFFHLLRGQALRKPQRPLVVFTPKSLLRHKLVSSQAEEFLTGTAFKSVLGPAHIATPVRRAVLCSGKVYYDLLARMAERAVPDVALIRLEQLYPFPDAALRRELARFPGAEVVWCQEEPQNMGAWSYLDRKIEAVLREIGSATAWPSCVSRPENPSTAIGTTSQYEADQLRLVDTALDGDARKRP